MSKVILQEASGEVEAVEVIATMEILDGEACSNHKGEGCNINTDSNSQTTNTAVTKEKDLALAKVSVDENHNALNERKAGCKCKRSACLRKFCECVQAKIHCGPSCKCFNCGYEGVKHGTMQAGM
jgi:hypothetical protein